MARVLVADNDSEALALLLLDLRLEGHEVVGVGDGDAAVASIDDVAPDVVVLDHRMPPGPTGMEVGIRLRATRPDLQIVIYSNYQDVDLVACASAHGITFLPKGNLRALRRIVAG